MSYWQKSIRAIFGKTDDFTLEQRFIIATWFFSGLACIYAVILNIFLGLQEMIIYGFLFTIPVFYLYYLARVKKKFVLVIWIFVCLVYLGLPAAYIFNGGSLGPAHMASLMCILLITVLLKGKARNIVVISLIVIITSLVYIELQYPEMIVPYPDDKTRIIDNTNTYLQFSTICFLIMAYVSSNYFNERKKIERLSTEKYQAELEKVNMISESKLLRQQINPHFIYNSLNSIQSFITSDKSGEASRYLTQFAQLMRFVLNQSRSTFVLISDEVTMLKNYIELEQMRFSNQFTYSITISPEIDPDYYTIPSMLIQPYVENAIIHGLLPKNGEACLTLSFLIQQDNILCEIEDNGIGREKSGQKRKLIQSLGHAITSERIDLLKKVYSSEISIEIADLYNEQKEPSGTRVRISMPYREK